MNVVNWNRTGRADTLNSNKEGDPPSQRYVWIEADEARLKALDSDPTMKPDHRFTLNDLVLATYYEDKKGQLFGVQTADQEIRDVIDDLLDLSIMEMQRENATVVGLVVILIMRVLETHRRLRKQILGPVLFHSRSSAEVRAEMACVSKTLDRLREELDATLVLECRSKIGVVKTEEPHPSDGSIDESDVGPSSLDIGLRPT